MKIAFQGEPGAYSEEAIFEHYSTKAISTLPCPGFRQVFDAVSQENCDLGFVPIENSLAGSIYQVYDLLSKYDLWIVGEHYLRVNHCLIGHPCAQIKQIDKVISHPQALMQCEGYIARHPAMSAEQVYDTAGSVKILKEKGGLNWGAIASKRAAKIYDMQILEESIEDDPANFTRFFIISREPVQPACAAKTSIVFTLHNEPGALFKTMSVFALRNIDLTKIDSRPLVGKPWEYLFYLDFKGGLDDPVVGHALDNLREFTTTLRVFGSYPDQRR